VVTVPEITLTSAEVFHGAVTGVMRQVSNLRDGRQDRHGIAREQGWQAHIEGALGELVVARYTNRFWSGNLGKLRADDVGDLQVRTRSRHDYELILHPTDPDDRAFVLVTGTAPTYRLIGWIRGREGKRQEWWKDPAGGRAAYFVPQRALRPMVALGKEVAP